MEPTATGHENAANYRRMGVGTLGAALYLMVSVWLGIVGRWKTYGGVEKSLAGVFLLQLVLIPLIYLFREKTWAKGLEFLGKSDLFLAYCWLWLAMVLFNHF